MAFVCPECEAVGVNKTFARNAALGAHRFRVHGVKGESKTTTKSGTRTRRVATARSGRAIKRSTVTRRRRRRSRGLNEDGLDTTALLKLVFPNGVPAQKTHLDDAREWLDWAERLYRRSIKK